MMTQEAKRVEKNAPIRWGAGLSKVVILFTNHMDAWMVTAVIAFIALLLHEQISLRGIRLLSAVTALYWFGFALNDYYDVSYDALDEKKARSNFFVQFPFSAKVAKALFWSMAALLVVAFVPFGGRGLMIVWMLLFAAWAYSSPPLRVKSRPGWDLLIHATFVESYPYFATIFILQVTWTGVDYLVLFLLLIASLGAQLEQQARDFAVDAQSDRNFTTTFGLPTTLLLLKIINSMIILLVIVGVATGTIPRLFIPFLLIATPIILHRFIRKPDQPRSELLVNVSTIAAGTYAAVLLLMKLFG